MHNRLQIQYTDIALIVKGFCGEGRYPHKDNHCMIQRKLMRHKC
ncbi:MAG: hypothetical protein RLZZ177_109 [Pseudomonadota bacterium]|jgi:hypothetical protein